MSSDSVSSTGLKLPQGATSSTGTSSVKNIKDADKVASQLLQTVGGDGQMAIKALSQAMETQGLGGKLNKMA